MTDEAETTRLLREIRDNQREALRLQQEQVAMYQRQWERAERINERAEALQRRAGGAIRTILMVAVPLVVLLLALMLWPYLSALAR
jgi:hypothetical protein